MGRISGLVAGAIALSAIVALPAWIQLGPRRRRPLSRRDRRRHNDWTEIKRAIDNAERTQDRRRRPPFG